MSTCTGILSGQDSVLQVGIESTWGTKVPATVKLPFLNESFELNLNYKESEALVGKKATSRMDIMSKKPSGGYEMYVSPDVAPIMFYVAFGRELSPVTPSGATLARKHYMTPIASGLGKCLPPCTIEVDRVTGKVALVSMKVNSVSISAAPEDYLKLQIDWIGYDEEDIVTMTTGLTLSKKAYFKFVHGELIMDNLDDTYSINQTQQGLDSETITSIPIIRTGLAGETTEIYAFGLDENGKQIVYRFIGTPITRAGVLLTFTDTATATPVVDTIQSIRTAAGLLEVADWEVYSKVYASIEDFTITFNNNLRDNRFVLNGDDRQAEIQPQQREATISFSAEYSTPMDQLRKHRFKTGETLEIILDFELPDLVEAGFPYAMSISLPATYLTSIQNPVAGPDVIMFNADGMCAVPDTAIGAGTTGKDGTTAALVAARTSFYKGLTVEVDDPDGDEHVFKYIGATIVMDSATLQFTTVPSGNNEIVPIFSAGDLLDDANWEIQDVIVASFVDERTTKWSV